MPFTAEGNYERSPQQEYIHQLMTEFRETLTREKYSIPEATDGVVALSGPPKKNEDGVYESHDETTSRIDFAIQSIKQVVAERLHKPIDEVTNDDIIEHGPPLLLNGEPEQLPPMQAVALGLGFPEEKITLVDCGPVGTANTKTQFTAMDTDPRFAKVKHWTFISSGYHVPRVARTAAASLDKNKNFDVIGVPLERDDYDVYRKVRGEVKRIVTYADKGDISRHPAR